MLAALCALQTLPVCLAQGGGQTGLLVVLQL
jgi:hypothetical protein